MQRMLTRALGFALVVVGIGLAGCAASRRVAPPQTHTPPHSYGHLLLIGGGLDPDNRPVYERFVTLVRRGAEGVPPHVSIMTAATLRQQNSAERQCEVLARYCPECIFSIITCETSDEDSVRLIDAAHGLFFTGGDQKRITARYLSEDRDTPPASAMRRLLLRGGVIAGTSAGDAMMSDPMFLTGRSAAALGIVATTSDANDVGGDDERSDGERAAKSGPQIGKGMGFLPWAVADSHFFERHRFGRLVAALEQSGRRFGVGVSENACVGVDLEKGEILGVGAAESLLVDVAALRRDGLSRLGVHVWIISEGTKFSLATANNAQLPNALPRPNVMQDIAPGTTSGERARSAVEFFRRAADQSSRTTARLRLDGYDLYGWSNGAGGAVVDIVPWNPEPLRSSSDHSAEK